MPATYYPPVSFYYNVNFQGITTNSKEASFMEVSGLNVEIPVEEVAEGGVLQFKHKLPNVPRYPNLVLKRGLLTDSALIDWVNDALLGFKFTPAIVTINLLGKDAKPLATWEVHNAAPVKWSVSEFKSQDNSIAVESLELMYSAFVRTL